MVGVLIEVVLQPKAYDLFQELKKTQGIKSDDDAVGFLLKNKK